MDHGGYVGTLSCGGEREIELTSTAFTDRVGWREITAVGDRTTLVLERAGGQHQRPPDRLSRRPLILTPGPAHRHGAGPPRRGGCPGPAWSRARARLAQPRGLDGATRSFTDLVARQQLTVGFGILALGLAIGLGAIHAFAPGQGKTVMAAYLVGQRGTLRQAGVIGLTVTATHTAGVLILGIVLSASTSLAPETISRGSAWPAASCWSPSAPVCCCGPSATARAHGRQQPLAQPHHSHDDGHGHSHDHAPHDHQTPVEWRSLVPLGLAGDWCQARRPSSFYSGPSPSAGPGSAWPLSSPTAWVWQSPSPGPGSFSCEPEAPSERRLVTSGPASGRLASAAAALPLLTPACIIAAGLFLAGHRGFRRRGWWAVVTLLWGLAGGAVAVAGLSELASDDGQGRWLISVSIALLAAGLSALAPGRDVGATAR